MRILPVNNPQNQSNQTNFEGALVYNGKYCLANLLKEPFIRPHRTPVLKSGVCYRVILSEQGTRGKGHFIDLIRYTKVEAKRCLSKLRAALGTARANDGPSMVFFES